ncbi:MAG: NAD(P)/FAD-dependent oxidoreductase [Actinomycetota bacterium]
MTSEAPDSTHRPAVRRVLVTGGGIAGPAVAYWLARTGAEVDIVERSAANPRRGYVVNAFGQCLDVLRAMGLDEAIDEARLRIDTTIGLDDGAAPLYRRDLRSLTDGSRGIAAYRSDLASMVESAALACPGVRLERGRTVRDLVFDDERVAVTLSDDSEADYDLVIGADGVHSSMRRRYVTEDAEQRLPIAFVGATTTDTVGLDPATRLEYCSIGANGVLVASGDGQATLVIFVRSDVLPDDASTAPLAALRQITASWPEPFHTIANTTSEDDEVFSDRLVQVQLPTWSVPRLVLLGDAAACMSPLSGRGVDAAVTGAFILARALGSSSADLPAALRSYEEQLRPEIEKLQAAAVRRASMSAPRNRFQVAALRASLRYTPDVLFQRLIEREFTNPLAPALHTGHINGDIDR